MAARKFHIKAIVNGQIAAEVQGETKKRKEQELRDMVDTLKARKLSGEIWVTESNAKAWQVWGYRAGDQFAFRGRVVQKSDSPAAA